MSQLDIVNSFSKLDNVDQVEMLDTLIDNFVNRAYQPDIENLAKRMIMHHRTLVQKKMALFLHFAQVLAKDYNTNNYDARNAISCKLSSDIMKMTNNCAVLPFI